MILKEFDSKQNPLYALQNLLKASSSDKQKALILKDLTSLKNGIEAEKQNAYYINFYAKDSKNLIVLHDIRLEHKGRTAQIDHMILSRFGVEIFESKSFKGTLTINDDNSLQVAYKNNTKSFSSPIEQSKRHADVLREFIKDNADLGKRIEALGGFDIKNIVLIHPETTITNNKLPKNFYRADIYMSKRLEEIDKLGLVQMVKFITKMTDIDSVQELASLIIAAHKPVEFDYKKKYRISKQKVKDVPLEKPQTKEETTEIKPQSKKLEAGNACPFCKNELVLRQGKNNIPFLGCSNFPKCRFTRRVAKVVT